jgi:hypothetical protein
MTARIDEMGPTRVPPTTGGAGVSLAATCDPAITNLLSAFKAALNLKLAAAWKAAAGQAQPGTVLIADTFPHEPTRASAERTWTGCALFMWRDKERLYQSTQVYEDAAVTGTLMLVLPPLCEEDTVRLEPIRNAAKICLDLFTEHFGDPGYTPTFGDTSYQVPGGDFLSAAGLDEFRFTDAEYGHLPSDVGLEMHHAALILTWSMHEREDFVLTQYETLSQIDTEIVNKDDTGETTTVATHYPVGP